MVRLRSSRVIPAIAEYLNMLIRWLLLPLLILLLLPVPAAAQKMIALSFDDAPRGRGAFWKSVV